MRCPVCWFDFVGDGLYCSKNCKRKVAEAGGPRELADEYDVRAQQWDAVHEGLPALGFDKVADVARAQADLLRSMN